MSQKLIEQELIDPLPELMPRWTSLVRYAIQNNIKIVDGEHNFTEKGHKLQSKFSVNYSNSRGLMCLVTEAFGGFNNGHLPYNPECCNSFVYAGAIEALTSWDNFIQYKVKLYDHIVQNHPNVKI